MIEVLFLIRKEKFKDNPILPEGLDLIEEEEQITHKTQVEEDLKFEKGLGMCSISYTSLRSNCLLADIFKFDSNYIETEEKYKADYCKAGTLGEGSSDSESVSGEGDEEGTFQNSSLGSCLNML